MLCFSVYNCIVEVKYLALYLMRFSIIRKNRPCFIFFFFFSSHFFLAALHDGICCLLNNPSFVHYFSRYPEATNLQFFEGYFEPQKNSQYTFRHRYKMASLYESAASGGQLEYNVLQRLTTCSTPLLGVLKTFLFLQTVCHYCSNVLTTVMPWFSCETIFGRGATFLIHKLTHMII